MEQYLFTTLFDIFVQKDQTHTGHLGNATLAGKKLSAKFTADSQRMAKRLRFDWSARWGYRQLRRQRPHEQNLISRSLSAAAASDWQSAKTAISVGVDFRV